MVSAYSSLTHAKGFRGRALFELVEMADEVAHLKQELEKARKGLTLVKVCIHFVNYLHVFLMVISGSRACAFSALCVPDSLPKGASFYL